MALGNYEEVLSAVSGSNDDFSKTFTLYTKFLQGQDVSGDFDSLIESGKNKWFVQILGSFYLVKNGRVDEAINLLQRHENSLECVLLLTQLYIHQNKIELTEKEVSKASQYAQDNIIFNLAEAYLNSVKNGESLRGALYFFEELSHTNPSYRSLIGQLVLNLQLHQFPEAEEVFRQLEEFSASGSKNADLIANQIAYASITGDDELAASKREELAKLNPSHPSVVDYKEKNELFDTVVAKYSEQIVN